MRSLLVLICGFTVGCGSGGPYDYVKVRGKISYEDGSPIPNKGIRLRFVAQDAPQTENAFPRPAFARVDSQGEFDCATSYKYGDGLIPGKHKVSIEMGNGPSVQLAVPKEFQTIATTPLVVDTADSPFEIKVPKPKGKR